MHRLRRGSMVFLDGSLTSGVFNNRGPVNGVVDFGGRVRLAIGKACTTLPRGYAVQPGTIVSLPSV